MHVTSSLIILVTAVLAVLTLHRLGLLTVGPRDRPRRRAQTVLLIVVLLCSALVIAGADAAAETAPAGFRTAIARNLGAIDETVTGKAVVTGGPAPYLQVPRTPFFPTYTADRLRNSLTGVTGALLVTVSSTAPKLRAMAVRKPAGAAPAAASAPAMTRVLHSTTTMSNTVGVRRRGLSCGPTASSRR